MFVYFTQNAIAGGVAYGRGVWNLTDEDGAKAIQAGDARAASADELADYEAANAPPASSAPPAPGAFDDYLIEG
jgi:hypothetical protein